MPSAAAAEPLDRLLLVAPNADALGQAHAVMEYCDQTARLGGLLEPMPGLIQLSRVRIDFTP
jgi:hypothetical protein